MNTKFRLAIIFLIIGMASTVGGAVLKVMELAIANTVLMLGLAAHFSGAGILVFSLNDNRKLG